MSDLCERLRRGEIAYATDASAVYKGPTQLEAEAAAEIDRLREALEKIARCAGSGTLADMALAALAKEVGK